MRSRVVQLFTAFVLLFPATSPPPALSAEPARLEPAPTSAQELQAKLVKIQALAVAEQGKLRLAEATRDKATLEAEQLAQTLAEAVAKQRALQKALAEEQARQPDAAKIAALEAAIARHADLARRAKEQVLQAAKIKEAVLKEAGDKGQALKTIQDQQQSLEASRTNEQAAKEIQAGEEALEKALAEHKQALNTVQVLEQALKEVKKAEKVLDQTLPNEKLRKEIKSKEHALKEAQKTLEAADAKIARLKKAKANLKQAREQALAVQQQILKEAQAAEQALKQVKDKHQQALKEVKSKELAFAEIMTKQQALEKALAAEKSLTPDLVKGKALKAAMVQQDNLVRLFTEQVHVAEIARQKAIEDVQKLQAALKELQVKEQTIKAALPQNPSLEEISVNQPQFQSLSASGQTLESLIDWSLPVLGDAIVSNIQTAGEDLKGEITIAGVVWTLEIFKTAEQNNKALAFSYKGRIGPAQMVKALKGTLLSDIEFDNPLLVWTSGEDAGRTIVLPAPLALRAGVKSMTLQDGLHTRSPVHLSGKSAHLVSLSGLSADGLMQMEGAFSPHLLTGGIQGDAVRQAFIEALDLSIPLPDVTVPRAPGFLDFSSPVLKIKGKNDGSTIVGGITTRISTGLPDGTHLDFIGALTASSDGKALDIRGLMAGDWDKPLQIDWLKLSEVGLSVTDDGSHLAVKIDGKPHIMGAAPVDGLVATLSLDAADGGMTDAVITLSGAEIPLGKLVDWDLPILGDVKVRDLAVGTQYLEGGLDIAGEPWDLAVFKAPGQSKAALLLEYDKDIRPSSLVKGLEGTLLNDIELVKPAFFWASKDDSGRSATLPPPIARKTGTQKVTLRDGLQTLSKVRLVGGSRPAKLVSHIGLPEDGALSLQGSFDPLLFSGGFSGKEAMQAFIAGLDLAIPLPGIKTAGVPEFVKFTSPELTIKGKDDGSAIIGGIVTDISAHLPDGQTLAFLGALTLSSDGEDLDIRGTLTKPWKKALGIAWLDLRDVTLEIARHGTGRTVSIGGQTDIGSIQNLTATLEVEATGDRINDVGIALTGPDIPLDALPGIKEIPEVGHFKVRNLYLNNRAFAGTFYNDLPALSALNGLSGTIFEANGGTNLALSKNGCALTDLLPPLPELMLAPLKGIRIGKGAFILSTKPFKAPIGTLPDGARQFFETIYGSDKPWLRLGGGVSLVADLDLGSHAAALGSVGHFKGNPVFAGEIDGLFGGVPSIKLMADLPMVTLPEFPAFLVMPEDFESFLFISANPSEAAVGIGLLADTLFHTRPKPVTFTTQFQLEADTSGGLSIDIQGITDTLWEEALGIKGFDLKAGTRLEAKVSATSDVTLTMVGLTDIGSKEVKVIMSATANLAAEVIDKGAFEGSLSSLSLADLVQLSDRIVMATGGAPTKPDFPNVTLKKVDFAFASPGVDVPEINLVGGGIRFGGEVWALFPDAPLGDFFAQLDGNGMIMKGDLHDVQVGPVALHNNHLDTQSTLMPPEAYFKMSGAGELFGDSADFAVSLGTTRMALLGDIDAGEMLQFDFRAFANLPGDWMSPATLAKTDFGLSSHLKSDLGAWLRSSGMQRVQASMAGLDAGLKTAKQTLDQAQTALNTLNDKIDKARKKVAKSRKNQKQQIDSAQAAVDKLNKQLKGLDKEIASAKSKIRTCDQTHKVCIIRNPFTGKCTKKGTVADLKARYKCDQHNLDYGAEITKKTALKESAKEALKLARKALQDVKAGTAAIPVDLDPLVADLLTEREAAATSLALAKQAVEEASKGDEMILKAIDVAKQPGAFVIKNSLIQGSLQKAIAGTPVVIGIDFEAFGQDYHQGLAFSLTDQPYNADQMELLALFAVTQAAKLDSQFPELVLNALHQVYDEKHTAVENKLEAALRANGLD